MSISGVHCVILSEYCWFFCFARKFRFVFHDVQEILGLKLAPLTITFMYGRKCPPNFFFKKIL